MKYYVDENGNYLGGWDKTPPVDAIEVELPPSDARQKWDGDKFLPVEQTIQEKIDALESQITTRNLIGYNNGDEYAINKINKIEAQIQALRG